MIYIYNHHVEWVKLYENTCQLTFLELVCQKSVFEVLKLLKTRVLVSKLLEFITMSIISWNKWAKLVKTILEIFYNKRFEVSKLATKTSVLVANVLEIYTMNIIYGNDLVQFYGNTWQLILFKMVCQKSVFELLKLLANKYSHCKAKIVSELCCTKTQLVELCVN